MTNILNIVVALTTVTNWTGIQFQDRELGVVLTNHVAQIEYGGKLTDVLLLTELSSVAVWRMPVPTDSYVTNIYHWPWFDNYCATNIIVPTKSVTNVFLGAGGNQ